MLALAIRNTNKLIREKSKSENVRLGRFFAKRGAARIMADAVKLNPEKTAYTILDPGAGTGILSAAMVEHICKNAPNCRQIFLTCYEIDPELFEVLEDNLERIRKKCRHDYDVRLFATALNENYLVDYKNHYAVTFYGAVEDKFDIVICNPPTELIDKGSPEAECAGGISMLKISAAYLFAKVAALHLEPNGQLSVMLPTAFASASSLAPIREALSPLKVRRIHLFIGAQKNKKRAIPLKKSMILAYESSEQKQQIVISTSASESTDEGISYLPELDYDFVVDAKDGSLTLPKSAEETRIVKFISSFPETLTSLRLKMSTGLVVDSKCPELLSDTELPGSIPLLRQGAITMGGTLFPAPNVKKQYLIAENAALFQRNKNLIIIKRIPAKSDERFINSATYFAGQRPANQYISTHNKINFIDTKNPKDEMSTWLTFGLFCLLNSTIYDRYVSIISKSKQINSKEMKNLPLPPRGFIESIGSRLMEMRDMSVAACDSVVNSALHIRQK